MAQVFEERIIFLRDYPKTVFEAGMGNYFASLIREKESIDCQDRPKDIEVEIGSEGVNQSSSK